MYTTRKQRLNVFLSHAHTCIKRFAYYGGHIVAAYTRHIECIKCAINLKPFNLAANSTVSCKQRSLIPARGNRGLNVKTRFNIQENWVVSLHESLFRSAFAHTDHASIVIPQTSCMTKVFSSSWSFRNDWCFYRVGFFKSQPEGPGCCSARPFFPRSIGHG